MSIKNLLIVSAEPKSVFLEIFFKYLNSNNKFIKKKRLVLVGNKKIIDKEAKINNYKKKIYQIYDFRSAIKDKLNIINVEIKKKDYKKYISECFKKSISIIKKNQDIALINGPVDKKTFLNNKYLGVTEYLAKKTGSKNPVMLIYNKKISVSPITTHLPIKYVSKHINKNKIIKNVRSINSFYKKNFKKKPRFAILGLNPHCESISKISEEKKIIIPAIAKLKGEMIFIKGPFSADSFFIKKNIDEYDVVIGMYHDQVLTPLKTLFNFDAINITIGLPFIRVSPDHGPNSKMYLKNKSDPSSIFCAMDFFNKI